MEELRNLYAMLDLNIDSTQDEIKKSFRKKALDCHPDTSRMDKELAHEMFIELKSAFDILMDPILRAEYDKLYRHFIQKASAVDEAPPFTINSVHEDSRMEAQANTSWKPENEWIEFVRLKEEYFSLSSTITSGIATTLSSILISSSVSLVVSMAISFLMFMVMVFVYTLLAGTVMSIIGLIFAIATGAIKDILLGFLTLIKTIKEQHTKLNVRLQQELPLKTAELLNGIVAWLLKYIGIPGLGVLTIVKVFIGGGEDGFAFFVSFLMAIPIGISVFFAGAYISAIREVTISELAQRKMQRVRLWKRRLIE